MTYIPFGKVNFILTALTSVQFLLSSAAYSQSITDNVEKAYFDRAIIFGDSLSDNGAFSEFFIEKLKKNVHDRRTLQQWTRLERVPFPRPGKGHEISTNSSAHW
ncbi:hypothetical protein QLQ09_13100 [Brucella sp. NM4]|uniref:hypothetical protein n=1 Tax=Brucella/Ochrobactrum group TaxID=2826938 RepID=UPI0024BCF693|nr:hypothetical protein [Brucella sp. NM4]WHS32772.1 hypothetical protein QLQ09_13100 [Brucella sp. NM4]WHT42721.1 hypothetical protein QLQ11_04330 [Ochrobactrum sp. SSR]